MDVIYPTISSSVTGPLGVAHLPRLWLKILLHACGRLPEGYRHGTGGFDETTCSNIGVDVLELVKYVETEKPDYQQFETWVREHATKLDADSIAAQNDYITNRKMPEEMAATRRAELKIADSTFSNAVMLNNLDDWAGAHRSAVGNG
jgi:hypothetical protein